MNNKKHEDKIRDTKTESVPSPLVWFQSRPGSCWLRGLPPSHQGLDCMYHWTSSGLRTCWGSLPAVWGPNPVWDKEEKTEVSISFWNCYLWNSWLDHPISWTCPGTASLWFHIWSITLSAKLKPKGELLTILAGKSPENITLYEMQCKTRPKQDGPI